jgi:hypothetical protein
MRFPHISLSAGGLMLMSMSAFSLAEAQMVPPPPPASTAPQATTSDLQAFPAVRGDLDRLTLTARGDIDGFILRNGTEVKTAPGLSAQIASAIKPGDSVTVRGLKAAALPLVSAVAITDESTHRTFTEPKSSSATPIPGPPPQVQPPLSVPHQGPRLAGQASGHVRMALHGPLGEVNGVLLDDGTILRIAPDQVTQLATLLQPNQAVVAKGTIITNALGSVVDVQQIGPSRDKLVALAPPARPADDRGPVGPGRGPIPPAGRAPQPLPPAPPAS